MTTPIIWATCDNCGANYHVDALREIKHYHQRVDIGGEVPAGECPECGALAYLSSKPAGVQYRKATALNAAVSAAYQEMLRETRRELGGCLRSRGKTVCALDLHGNILPAYECGLTEWKGTQKHLDELIMLAMTGTVSLISIVVALDYADSVRDFAEGNYDPIVAEADIVIYDRDA